MRSPREFMDCRYCNEATGHTRTAGCIIAVERAAAVNEASQALATQHAPFLAEFERQLLNTHVHAQTHSKAIAFARAVEVPDMTIAKMLAAAVLRSDNEVEAFDEGERTQ